MVSASTIRAVGGRRRAAARHRSTSSATPAGRAGGPAARSRASTRYSLPGSSTMAALAADELRRPSRSRARRARWSSVVAPTGRGPGRGQRGGSRRRPGPAGAPRRRARPGRPRRACPRRPRWPGPGRRRCRRPRGPGRRRLAVGAHAGQDDGRAPRRRRRRRRSGTGRRRPVGRSSPAAAWSSAVRRSRPRRDTVRWRSPGAMCTVPGASGVAVDRLDHAQRAEPVQPAGELRVKTGGMCWTTSTGTGESRGQPRDDLGEGLRAAGGGRR